MSGAATSGPAVADPAGTPPTPPTTPIEGTPRPGRSMPESLKSQTFIIAVLLIMTLDGTLTAIFLKGSAEVIATQSGLVIGGILGGIMGYFFSASKHPSATTPTSPTQGTIP